LSEDTPLTDASKRIDGLPEQQAELSAVATQGGNVGVQGSVRTRIGKGWSVGAAGQWMRDTGWAVAATLGWKGK
jgi:hypothetical protein